METAISDERPFIRIQCEQCGHDNIYREQAAPFYLTLCTYERTPRYDWLRAVCYKCLGIITVFMKQKRLDQIRQMFAVREWRDEEGEANIIKAYHDGQDIRRAQQRLALEATLGIPDDDEDIWKELGDPPAA